MPRLIYVLSLLISSIFSYAQVPNLRDACGKNINKDEGKLMNVRACFNSGCTFTVLDSLTKEPLPLVTATLNDKKTGTCTDFDGNFKMQVMFIDEKKYCTKDLILSCPGYNTKKNKKRIH